MLIAGSPQQGRYPASEVNDGACPEKPVHLSSSWPALNGSVTGSPEIAGLGVPVVPVTRKLMWPSTTPHDWLTSRCCRMRSKQPRWGFCCGPWPGSMVRGSAARGSSPTTAAPTAPGPGEKPVQRLVSHQNAPGHTPHDPGAVPGPIQGLSQRAPRPVSDWVSGGILRLILAHAARPGPCSSHRSDQLPQWWMLLAPIAPNHPRAHRSAL